ncbi:Protein Tob1 [Halotydeus destructor]|nr:Protein Tob1 [Halotydeus destructor]
MYIEIQVALNFLISFLYNKLPRRRVNQFGEELDGALKVKFEGHWYPETPFKGSAYRCLKTTPPLDPVFDIAAREAGMDLKDIQDNLPHELSIWIDPGEVSYRMSEKGPVKILYSESAERTGLVQENVGREVTRTFNPEATCFEPVESSLSRQFVAMSLTSGQPTSPSSPFPAASSFGSPASSFKSLGNTSPTTPAFGMTKPSPHAATMTTAAFAATKFGSTKLKTNSKRSQRMSPTEFSNYIKQKAIQQQQQQQVLSTHRASGEGSMLFGVNSSPQNSRSISPEQNLMDSFMPMQSPSSGGSSLASSLSSTGNGPFYGASNYKAASSVSSRLSPPFAPSVFHTEDTYLMDDWFSSAAKAQPSPPTMMMSMGMSSAQHDQHPLKLAGGATGCPTTGALGRYMSFLDSGDTYGSPTECPGPGSSPLSPLSSLSSSDGHSGLDSSAKQFDKLSNLGRVTYTNQYQHLLVAN